jgi:hypothetical protein
VIQINQKYGVFKDYKVFCIFHTKYNGKDYKVFCIVETKYIVIINNSILKIAKMNDDLYKGLYNNVFIIDSIDSKMSPGSPVDVFKESKLIRLG